MKVGKSSLAAQFLTSDHVETFANQGRHIYILYGASQAMIMFPVWLRNRLKTAGLEPILSLTEKSFIAS